MIEYVTEYVLLVFSSLFLLSVLLGTEKRENGRFTVAFVLLVLLLVAIKL